MAMRGAKSDTKHKNPKIYSEISARLLRLKICHFWRARFRLVESRVGVIGVVGLVCALGVPSVFGVFCWAGVAIVAVAWVCGVGLSSLKQVLSRELVRGVARDFALFDFTDLSYLFALCRF